MAELAKLELVRRERPGEILKGGGRKTRREFLDFVVNGVSLREIVKEENPYTDVVSCLWLPVVDTVDVGRLLLEEDSVLENGYRALYVCPECGDLGCGAVTVKVEMDQQTVTWRNFTWQTNYDEGYRLDRFDALGDIVFDRHAYEDILWGLLL